ncbi:MAG: matrixin family metalloprotease [Phycisphaerae bacterium]
MKSVKGISGLLVLVVALVGTAYPYGQLLNVNSSGVVITEVWDLNAVLSDRAPGDGRTIIIHFGNAVDAGRKAALMAAHDTWEAVVVIDFDDSPTFSPSGANLGDGFNTHVFNVILGGALAVAPTVFNAETGQITEGDVYYSSSIQWFTGSGNCRGNKFDAQAVATHEFGHVVGIAHSGEIDATLFPSTSRCSFAERVLEPDDEISISRLYAQDAGDTLVPTGGISGRVISGNDSNDGKVCALVYAFSSAESPITNFNQAYAQVYSGSVIGDTASNNTSGPSSGFYQIDGLPDGDYFVLLDAPGNLINANQVSNYCAANVEGGITQEWYNGIAESGAEGCLGCALAVTVSGGAVTAGIDIITETGTCTVTEDPEVSCSDGIDNDCDGFADSQDSDCPAGCLGPADCNDGVACTDDDCVGGNCVNTPNDANCPDDGLFCNGTEFCDAAADCSSTGDPCTGGTICNEVTDTCDPECTTDPDCDDGLFCNGAETCVGGSCQAGSDPCPGQGCDEANDQCITCAAKNDPCSVNEDCCSGVCKRNGRCRGVSNQLTR